jgi:tRNA U34 5-methylaminomethyl-2-thiouridine-forming methyltransferase MnmC
VQSAPGYKLVKVASGAHSVHSLAYQETFHPVIGPAAEAEALYVRQIRLLDRLRHHAGEFVMWDVGLGAAANPLTVLCELARARASTPPLEQRAGEGKQCPIRFLSFDQTIEPLKFALGHIGELEFLAGYEMELEGLIHENKVSFTRGSQEVAWDLHLADFPTLLASEAAKELPKPHVIMFDAFSPATNPAMWTLPLFTRLFDLLDPNRPCVLPTYSRSTMLRVTLLLAGFFVGIGHATGEKEETTVAANRIEMVEELLGRRWLQRVRRSTSAEPLREPVYRQERLSPQMWDKLEAHQQFR